MPPVRLAQFQADIERARDLVGLGQALGGMTQGRVDSSDLHRAGLSQSVAAMDSYVHGVVLDRAVEMLMGRLQTQGGATKVGLNFAAVQNVMTAPGPAQAELAARTHVAQRLALETFQRPDAIGRALAMVGVPKIWSNAFPGNAGPRMTAVSLVVARRNRIAHSCDVDPLNPGNVTPLSANDALQAIQTIEGTITQLDPFC